MNVPVVGHTDGLGNFETNRTPSQRPAEAILASLISKHKIGGQRLFPIGVSFASPVATNSIADRRVKNRRVELVQMPEAK